MKTINLLALCLLIFLGIACNKAKEPSIIIASNTNIGIIPYKGSKQFNLIIKNEGEGELIIDNIQPSCKCIINTIKKLKIEANATDTVKLTMFSNNYGKLEETIAITSNIPERFKLVKINAITPDEK